MVDNSGSYSAQKPCYTYTCFLPTIPTVPTLPTYKLMTICITPLCLFQEPYFHWTFGVSEPDCYGLIQVSSGEAHLFFPRVEEAHTVWLGKPLSLDEYKCRYKVNYASYVDTVINNNSYKTISFFICIESIN